MAAAVDGYRRRRGWSAWHIGALGRLDFAGGFPALETLKGELPWGARPEQSQEEIGSALDAWESASTT